MITFEEIRKNPAVLAYVEQADNALGALGYTEHFLPHLSKCAKDVAWLLTELGYQERTVELARIAAFMHDIGNMVNRSGHAHYGAIIAFQLLSTMGMDPKEIGIVVSAIGHHDEATAHTIDAVTSALILADKNDVRRSRVRLFNPADIHDRVNYAVIDSRLVLDKEKKTITHYMTIDIAVSSVAEYFEIFLQRLLLCRKAALFFSLDYKMNVNKTEIF